MALVFLHTTAQVVRRMLIDLGLAVQPPAQPWGAYKGDEPNDPDDVITVYDTQGVTHGRVQPTGETKGPKGIQVRVRSAEPNDGTMKAQAIAHAFDTEVKRRTVNMTNPTASYLVHSISRTGDVIGLGTEEHSDRTLTTLNALVTITRVT